MARRHLSTIARYFTLVVVLVCFIVVLRRNLRGFEWNAIHWRPCSILAAIFLLQGGMLVNVHYLKFVFRKLGATLSPAAAYQIYFVTTLGRYIPGRIWQFLAMTAMARRYGIGAMKSTSLFIVNQILVVSTGFLFVIITGFLLSDLVPVARSISFLAMLPMFFVFIFPNTIVIVLNWVLKWIGRPEIDYRLTRIYVLITILYALGACILIGTGFYFLAQGIGMKTSNYFFMVSIYPLAYLLSYLTLIVPGQIGVRESFIIFLLKIQYSGAESALLALMALVWWMIVEMINCAIALITIRDVFKTIKY